MSDPIDLRPVTYADFCLGSIATSLEQIAEALAPKPPKMTPLPDDFPARDALHEAGIVWLEHVPKTAAALEAMGLDGASIHRLLTWQRVNA